MDLGQTSIGELGLGALEEGRDELGPLLRGALQFIGTELHDLLDALVVGPGT